MSSWFIQDEDMSAVQEEEKRQTRKYGPNRFYMRGGETKDIVLVDDNPACVYEHNPRINGHWRNWFTCLQNVEDDVVCCRKLGPETRYLAGYLTVVDCSKWVDKKGKEHQFDIKLVQGKIKTLKRWQRKKSEHDTLEGALFKVTREDGKSPSCGDEWSFQRLADTDKLFEHVKYKGKLLSELWAEAEQDEEKMENLMLVFDIKTRS